jgi:putative transposase
MGRRKTIFLPGYFRCRENYLFLLRRIKECVAKFCVTLIAYCLMPNHYHFLLRQDSDFSISDFIQAVFNSYAKAFNKMYKRSGTLFEGPFKSILVDSDEYLVHLCRYIHRNPIDVPRTSLHDITKWEFSNYLEWIGERGGTLVDHDFIHNYFPDRNAYQEFVLDYTPSKKLMKELEPYLLE